MAELIPILLTILVGVPQNLSSFQMIAISLFTDIAPSLSLMMEKPEVNLLNRPPRTTKDHIVDWKFLIHAYLFLGVLISASSQFLFFTYMYLYAGFKPAELIFDFGNWKDGYKGLSQDQLDTFLQTGQSVTFVSLVLMQIFG
jgi:sodium/potassium-transporting ATPase subunit alpha